MQGIGGMTIATDQPDGARGHAQGEAGRRLRREAHAVLSPLTWPVSEPTAYGAMVLGAGLTGAVIARQLAAEAGLTVLVVDRRQHAGGEPEHGCRQRAEALLDQPGIAVLLGVEFDDIRECYPHGRLVVTAPGNEDAARSGASAWTTVIVPPPAIAPDDGDRIVAHALAAYRRVFAGGGFSDDTDDAIASAA
jgi:hypothetical protein